LRAAPPPDLAADDRVTVVEVAPGAAPGAVAGALFTALVAVGLTSAVFKFATEGVPSW
jgi:hypothetical protein